MGSSQCAPPPKFRTCGVKTDLGLPAGAGATFITRAAKRSSGRWTVSAVEPRLKDAPSWGGPTHTSVGVDKGPGCEGWSRVGQVLF